MAQIVGYYEDNPSIEKRGGYQEGPFVLVNANGWRVEVRGRQMPVIPDSEIYILIQKKYPLYDGKTNDFEFAAKICDFLNKEVEAGRIRIMPMGWWGVEKRGIHWTYFPMMVRFTDTNEEVVVTYSQLYKEYKNRPFTVLRTRVTDVTDVTDV